MDLFEQQSEHHTPLVKTSDNHLSPLVSFHFTIDREGRVFILVTEKAYPMRVAYQCLEEVIDEVRRRSSSRSRSSSSSSSSMIGYNHYLYHQARLI